MRLLALHLIKKNRITDNYLTWSKTVETGCCTLLHRENVRYEDDPDRAV